MTARSNSPARRRSINRTVTSSTTVSAASGYLREKEAMRVGIKYGAMVGITPTLIGPDTDDCLCATSSFAARSSLRIYADWTGHRRLPLRNFFFRRAQFAQDRPRTRQEHLSHVREADGPSQPVK